MKKLLQKVKDWMLDHPWKVLTLTGLSLTVLIALFRGDIATITILLLSLITCGLSDRQRG